MKKIRTASPSDFSTPMEQAVLTPALTTDFSIAMQQVVLTPVFASIPASEKRNIPNTKGAGRDISFREAQHFVENASNGRENKTASLLGKLST